MSLGPIDFDTSTLRGNDMHGRTTISVAFWVFFSFTSQKYLIQKTDVSVAIQLPSKTPEGKLKYKTHKN